MIHAESSHVTARSRSDAQTAKPLVECRDLTVRYRLRRGSLGQEAVDVLAVNRVDLTLYRGETLGLVGGTGSGKSTIAQVIMGMVSPTSGTVLIAGQDIARVKGMDRQRLRRKAQVVLQDPYSSLDPRMKVGDIIAEPLTLGRPTIRRSARREIGARVAELLRLVRLPPASAELWPHQFSGGQRQRIAVARALASSPEIIVLDEPTSALDVSVRAQILTLLKTLQAQLGITYLIISHDLVTVAYLAFTVAVMHQGRIVEIGTTSTIYKSPRHPCTLELLSSAPGATGSFLNQPPTAALPPASFPLTACKFAYRCALWLHLGRPERCLQEDPALLEVQANHKVACHFSDQISGLAHNLEPAVNSEDGTRPRT